MDQVFSAEANDFDKPGESHMDDGISRKDHESGTTENFRVQDYFKLTFDSDRIFGFSAEIIEAFETPSDRDMTFTYLWRCHLARKPGTSTDTLSSLRCLAKHCLLKITQGGNKKELILNLMLYAEKQSEKWERKMGNSFQPISQFVLV
eukprot:IDg3990t1